jgi:hypothetical protein
MITMTVNVGAKNTFHRADRGIVAIVTAVGACGDDASLSDP